MVLQSKLEHYKKQLETSRRGSIYQKETERPAEWRRTLEMNENLRNENEDLLGIKITGLWASRALTESRDLSLRERIKNTASHLVFKTVLFSSDLVWWWARIRQLLGLGGGMDQELEDHMKKMAKEMGRR